MSKIAKRNYVKKNMDKFHKPKTHETPPKARRIGKTEMTRKLIKEYDDEVVYQWHELFGGKYD